jgi:serine phosphatase RsbU (regulator of sigma subunit)/anti-sigma regulatory factor (Ser/Thr protein kinase)
MKALSDCRILLVDDAKPNLDILVQGLKVDYKLSVAMNGETALQIAANTPPDLVLLDIVMPVLDGYEVCRRLRTMPETADVPIMFLSSLEEVQNKTRGFEAGANDYVTKPFDMLEVKARVRSLLKVKAYNDAVKEQIAGELRIARSIQMGMVPQDFAPLEDIYGVSIGAVLEPAREVGGDLYGLCEAGQERLVIFLGDVSGKGIPAAMVMVRAISLARLLAREIAEPGRILARLNDELATDNPSGMFVTFLCVAFEPKSRRIKMANAGHCRPLLLPRTGPPRWAVERLGTALGFETGLEFESTELTIESGDALILYSDGVTEAFNPDEECFGNDRLLGAATGLAGQSSTAITTNLLRSVRAFAGSAPQSDDIAILTMKIDDGCRKTLELRATPEEVMRSVEALQAFATANGVPERSVHGLALALEECGSNIVDHGLSRNPARTFRAVFERTPDSFVIELRDDGPAFDPTAHVRVGSPAVDEDMPGGWGLELVRRNVDEIRYGREGVSNVLRLTKHLVSASSGD